MSVSIKTYFSSVKKIHFKICLAILFPILCLLTNGSQAALSHDIALKWQTLTSKHFEVHFHNGEQELAEKTIHLAEHLLPELQKNLQWQASDVIEIIITDEMDFANGFVNPLFHLRMTIFPTAADEFFDFDNWLELLLKHELAHVLHLDKSAGKPEYLKNIFGRHYLLYPNFYQPSWLLEGYATYQETNRKRKVGRGQSSIFHMMMRQEVANGLKPVNQVNMSIATWPVGITRYLYGYYFFEFLEANYSKASIERYIGRFSENLIPFRLNYTSQRIYGKTFEELWQDFDEYLKNKFEPEINSIKSLDLVEGTQMTSTGYLKMFAQPLENGNLLYAESDAINPPRLLLKKLNIDKTEEIVEVHSEATFDSHPKSGILVSQIEIYRNSNAFYDLFNVDLADKSITRLTRGDRFRSAIWSPEGDKILAIYNKLGKHSLVLLNNEGHLVDLLWEGKPGEYVSGMDWAPDNKYIIASIKRNETGWNLEEFNIAQREWRAVTRNAFSEVQPQYGAEGKVIYFSANYDNIYNIQKLERASGSISKLSNVLGGAFSPRLNQKGELYYIGYSATGYDIYKLENKRTLDSRSVELKATSKTAQATIPTANFELSEYAASSHLKPTWWTPTFIISKNEALLGAFTSGSDALNRHSYQAALAFDFKSTTLSGVLNYSYDRWFPLIQTHLETRGRENLREDTYQVEMLLPFLSRDEKMFLGVNIAYEEIAITTEQNGTPTRSENVDPLMGIGAIYDSRKYPLLSVSPSNGRLLSFTAETSDVLGGNTNGQVLIAKWREYINIKPKHVLAFRFVGGFGLVSPRPFQLGGSQPDSDYFGASQFSGQPIRTSLYNKRRYALRGYPSDAASLVGRRMVLYNLEWRSPIKRYERTHDMLPIGIHHLSSTVFFESASVWDAGNSPDDYHYDVGYELNFHTELFFMMPIQGRLGIAYGFQEDGGLQGYFAFSSSF